MPALTWQPSLLAVDEPEFDSSLGAARRRFLGDGAWFDLVPGWLQGADVLFDRLLAEIEWEAPADRPMYDRIVAVPRLVAGRWPHKPDVVHRMSG